MIASAVISDRASPANVWRTLWITERSATIAPTPIAMQMKKNSSRCHDARISRAAMISTNLMAHGSTGLRLTPLESSLTTGRPSRSTSRSSATAATFGSCVTSTSVTPRVRRTCNSRSST